MFEHNRNPWWNSREIARIVHVIRIWSFCHDNRLVCGALAGCLLMKLSVLCAGMAEPHAGWAAIDELAELLVHYFDAELLSPKPWPSGWSSCWLERIRPHYQPVDTAGGDVLGWSCAAALLTWH